ncbi:MAG: hypothetical protein IT227_13010 [Flavobacteriales bacterium]|nr:hypothetical protein [Flavobacteriales bacterium]
MHDHVFTISQPERKVLAPQTVLHRFTQGVDAPVFSDCWISDEEFRQLMSNLNDIKLGQKSAAGLGRRRMLIWDGFAILKSWNQLSHRVKITLKKEVVAYVGKAASQSLYMEVDPTTFLSRSLRTDGKVRAPFTGIVTDVGGKAGIGYVVMKSITGNQVQRFENLGKVLVKRYMRVEKGGVISESGQVMKRVEYRMGGFDQIVIPRFRKDEALRKLRGTAANEWATIDVNQPIF